MNLSQLMGMRTAGVPAIWADEIEKTRRGGDDVRRDEATDTKGFMCGECERQLHLLSWRQQCKRCQRRFCGGHRLFKGRVVGYQGEQTLCAACYGHDYGVYDIKEEGMHCRPLMAEDEALEEEETRVNGRATHESGDRDPSRETESRQSPPQWMEAVRSAQTVVSSTISRARRAASTSTRSSGGRGAFD